MTPDEKAARWQSHRRRTRQMLCQCTWWGHHLCAERSSCVSHLSGEEQYADAVLQAAWPLQLRLF